MLANLVNTILGREETNTPAESAAKAGAKARRGKGKKGSKKRYNERRKKARATASRAGKVLHATDKNFASLVLGSDVPVVVDYWAPWCGPCKAMGPVLDELAADVGADARVVKLNVDDNPRTSDRYNIRSIPTMMIFSGGEVLDVLVGLQSKDRLAHLLEAAGN